MSNQIFEFTVDKPASTVIIKRTFAAPQSLVWDAFTTKELLDQWWAPKPLLSKTISMEFRVGGKRFYAMVTPEGQEHYGIKEYTSISPITDLEWSSSFTDAEGHINTQLPTSHWTLHFSEADDVTTVTMSIKHDTYANIETLIEMGFKEGFTMTLNELESLLSKQKH